MCLSFENKIVTYTCLLNSILIFYSRIIRKLQDLQPHKTGGC